MAWTDRSTTADIQPRIWLLTNGGPAHPGRLLVTRRPDLTTNGWLWTGESGLSSGLDAVGWTSGATQFQRVFYVAPGNAGGDLRMLFFDNDVPGSPIVVAHSDVLHKSFSNTDVAALTFTASGTRWMAVAVGATDTSGNSGYICVFETSDLGSAPEWWFSCSTDRPLPPGNPSNHDIVGVAPNGTAPAFYFRNGLAILSRIRRLGTNNWTTHEEPSVPTFIQASIVATQSQLSTPANPNIALAVVGIDNRLYTSRIAPADMAPAWGAAKPALPGGVTPATSPTALGGIAYHTTSDGTTFRDREKIFIVGNNFQYYELSTHNQAGDWDGVWTGPYVSPSGLPATIGTITTTTGDLNRFPRVFGAVGFPTYTLQEFSTGSIFNDYIKIQDYPVGVGNSGVAIAETSSAANTSLGIMTGTDRNYVSPLSPWIVRLRSSTDGANSFDPTDSTIQPLTGTGGSGGTNWYTSDPVVSVTSNLLHHSSTDVAFANGCHHFQHGGDNSTATRISYRRGTSAAAIGALTSQGADAYLIDDVAANIVDHPWVVTTTDAFGGVTAHVVYASFANPVGPQPACTATECYWRLGPNTPACQQDSDCSPPGVVKCDVRAHKCARATVPQLGGPARALLGTSQEVYAYRDILETGWSKICTLKNAFTIGVQDSDCTMLGASNAQGTTTIAPAPSPVPSGVLYVGPVVTWPVADSEMECQLQPPPPATGGKRYKCFNHYALRSVAADPFVTYRVYVAYTVGTATDSSIYFTKSAGGDSFGVFSTDPNTGQAKLVSGTGAYYVNPQITVDSDGTIVVSYLKVNVAPADTSGSAQFIIKMSTDGGTSWLTPPPASWNASTIQYQCGRGAYFLGGEYMDGKALGNRAFLNYPSGGSTTTPYVYQTAWVNKWNLTN